MNKTIGQILLWVGFLSGALATVFATANFSRTGMVISAGSDSKVFARGIKEDTAAFKAGIRSGDQIVSLNGKSVETASQFGKLLGTIKDDSPAKIVYMRTDDPEPRTTNVGVSHPWSTINWPWYLISAGVCLAGVCFLQVGKKAAVGTDGKTEASLKQIKLHLENVVNNAEALNNQIEKYKPRQILNFIEEYLLPDLSEFADGRDSITNEHGLEVFANVMTQFAAGERAINRAWSASADGYIEEAATCVDHGLAMLKSAQKLLNAA